MGRTILITGSNRGIGKAILERFAKESGQILIAHARRPSLEHDDIIANIEKTTNNTVVPLYFDLSEPEDIKTKISALIKDAKTIDVLVNNAGMVPSNSSFLMTNIDTMKKSFDINFFAHVLITQLVSKAMIRNKGGVITNLGSTAAQVVDAGQFEYVTSKAAIVAMSKKLAHELAPFGIRCNSVSPGLTETDMIQNMEPILRDRLLKQIPLNRVAFPDEIANLIHFICSPEASYINGQNFIIDGGLY